MLVIPVHFSAVLAKQRLHAPTPTDEVVAGSHLSLRRTHEVHALEVRVATVVGLVSCSVSEDESLTAKCSVKYGVGLVVSGGWKVRKSMFELNSRAQRSLARSITAGDQFVRAAMPIMSLQSRGLSWTLLRRACFAKLDGGSVERLRLMVW